MQNEEKRGEEEVERVEKEKGEGRKYRKRRKEYMELCGRKKEDNEKWEKGVPGG